MDPEPVCGGPKSGRLRFYASYSPLHPCSSYHRIAKVLLKQKQIRLREARRLMLGDGLDAASAAFRVGYEDPSYFSRDDKKLFGSPPQCDIVSLRSRLEA